MDRGGGFNGNSNILMDISGQIKSVLSMAEVVERYGYHPNRAGFIKCPFHPDKTASLRIYEKGWHCFGCGIGSSVIDFVMKLFGIDYRQAVVRLNADFGLGLSTNGRPDPGALRRLRAERAEKERARAEFEAEYMAKVTRYRSLWTARDNPANRDKLEYLDYWFEQNPFVAR